MSDGLVEYGGRAAAGKFSEVGVYGAEVAVYLREHGRNRVYADEIVAAAGNIPIQRIVVSNRHRASSLLRGIVISNRY